MPPWAEILDELRALRRSMDKIAAIVTGEQAKIEMHHEWVCGHRHETRGEAVACLAKQGTVRRILAEAEQGANGPASP